MKLNKKERQRLMRSIIETRGISTQSALMDELLKKGVVINQPTISRDLRDLAAVKAAHGLGRFVYQIPRGEPSVRVDEVRYKFLNLVRNIEHTGNLILVKVPPGEAQGVAKVIDETRLANILGTVAGDDTIIVVVDKKTNVRKILKTFKWIREGQQ